MRLRRGAPPRLRGRERASRPTTRTTCTTRSPSTTPRSARASSRRGSTGGTRATPLIAPGHVRHAAMFVWKDDARRDREGARLTEVRAARRRGRGRAAHDRHRRRELRTDYDWILDVAAREIEAAAEALITGEAYRTAMARCRAARRSTSGPPASPTDARALTSSASPARMSGARTARRSSTSTVTARCERFQRAVLDEGSDWHGMTTGRRRARATSRTAGTSRSGSRTMDELRIDVQLVSPTDVFYQYHQNARGHRADRAGGERGDRGHGSRPPRLGSWGSARSRCRIPPGPSTR